MPFSYANPTSGPSAGGIGWFNFGNFTLNPGSTVTGLTGTLNDGTTITFDLSLSTVSGTPRSFIATIPPTYPGAQFGTAGYTDINEKVVLYSAQLTGLTGVSLITLSNIVATDINNNPVNNYTLLIADGEATNLFENIRGQTNGEDWSLFTTVGTGGFPTLTGTGTQTFNITGNQQFGQMVSYVLATQSPNQVGITISNLDPAETRQGIAIGFATTRLRVQKNVGTRINSTDQFVLNINGTPSDQATTSGNISGIQAQTADIFAISGNTYTISELMAPGSGSLITDYSTTVSAANSTPAGSIPPTGSLPISFIPALGDDVIYTIMNAAPQVFTKTVDKEYADIGDILTYSVTVDNPNDFSVSNVLFTDTTPIGTTYIGNLIVTAPYTGTDPASGITITTIPPQSKVTISWQVQINTYVPIMNPINNFAQVDVPGGTSGMTNVVTTQVNTAYVTINKMTDKIYAQPNEIIMYTIVLSNAGNVVANNVVLTDAIPIGATFVEGSLVGATGTLPTLTLNTPIAAGGSATVSYKVKVGNAVPIPNPIPNSASATFVYTVNPNNINGKNGSATSNTVNTLINIAKLDIIKSANRLISYVGDTITYQIAITNNGNVAANNVVITDVLTTGTTYVAGSITVSELFVGDPTTAITLINPIAPGQTVAISFKVKVDTIPNPNPILNKATANYSYVVDPSNPAGVTGSVTSNTVKILVTRYNFTQQIFDIIESVAMEEAAIAAITNAEGAKIQRMSAMDNVTADDLLCLNNSMSSMMESIELLQSVLKQKLAIIDCQLNGDYCN